MPDLSEAIADARSAQTDAQGMNPAPPTPAERILNEANMTKLVHMCTAYLD
ncbi:hypothetical protein HDU98_009349 [Podochytrium sp. JEL0797]|nr:hypothetical protein HDU98_009349 [Podochytrium sp. JEL0797]